jgi:glutamate racemase
LIGIFDSGVGGLAALYELKALLPREDFIYLSDTKNCPYGTKSRCELVPIVKKNLSLLRERGADMILSACCTASTLYRELTAEEQSFTVPIILPAAHAATAGACSSHVRVTVIATEYTARAGAFTSAITELSPDSHVTEIAAQKLVELVECGMRDSRVDRDGEEYLAYLAGKIRATTPDVLILGCTHFSHVEATLGELLPGVRIVSPAREGARHLARIYKYRKRTARQQARLTYIRT